VWGGTFLGFAMSRLSGWGDFDARSPKEAARIEQMLDQLPKCVICGKGCSTPWVQKDADGKPAHLSCQQRDLIQREDQP
jgi:hypothetical protein